MEQQTIYYLAIGLGILFGSFVGFAVAVHCFVKHICRRFSQIENKQIELEEELKKLKTSDFVFDA